MIEKLKSLFNGGFESQALAINLANNFSEDEKIMRLLNFKAKHYYKHRKNNDYNMLLFFEMLEKDYAEKLNIVRLMTDFECNNLQLKRLPEEIWKMKNLEKFSCSLNSLTHLPESICTLTKLTVLNCELNILKELPNNIGSLVKLRHIICYWNQLSLLPESIAELKLLTHFSCAHNKLENAQLACN